MACTPSSDRTLSAGLYRGNDIGIHEGIWDELQKEQRKSDEEMTGN